MIFRQRNIIWFKPPFRKNVRSNIGHDFLNLIDKHFPKSSRFHKIFSRNTIKVSYSCMQNVNNIIFNHNRRLLGRKKKTTADKNCNCRNKEYCPLDNQCLTTNVIKIAEIKDNVCGDTKEYIGNTAEIVKKRYANHVKSLNVQRYSGTFQTRIKAQKKTIDLKPSSGQSSSEFLHTLPGK